MHRLGEPPVLAHDVAAYLGVLRWAAPAALAGDRADARRAAGPGCRRVAAAHDAGDGGAQRPAQLRPDPRPVGARRAAAAQARLPRFGAGHHVHPLPGVCRPRRAAAAAARNACAAAPIPARISSSAACCCASARRSRSTIAAEVLLFQAAGLMAARLGPAALAAHQIALNVASTTFMLPLALSQAAERACRALDRCGPSPRGAPQRPSWRSCSPSRSWARSACCCSPCRTRSPVPISIRRVRPTARRCASPLTLLGIVAVFQIADGVQAVALGALRGIGDTAVPMLIASACYWAGRLPAMQPRRLPPRPRRAGNLGRPGLRTRLRGRGREPAFHAPHPDRGTRSGEYRLMNQAAVKPIRSTCACCRSSWRRPSSWSTWTPRSSRPRCPAWRMISGSARTSSAWG